MTGAAYNALRRIKARRPFNADFRGSFAMVGYTGPGRPSFVRQVKYWIVCFYSLLNCTLIYSKDAWTQIHGHVDEETYLKHAE